MPTMGRDAVLGAAPRRLTIVVPTRSEIENIEPMVAALLALSIPAVEVSVLIVDNASTDGTSERASALSQTHPERVSVLHVCVSGLGTAYVAGFQHALGQGADLIVQMDCDFSHPPEVIPGMVATLDEQGADAVLGSRWTDGGGFDEEWPVARRLLSTFANRHYVHTLLGLPLADATGGFRLWRRETLLGMDLMRITSHGYVFQVEMASLAHRLGYRLVELPITFAERRAGRSKMSLAIQLEAALRVARLRWSHHGLTPADRAVVEAKPLRLPVAGTPASSAASTSPTLPVVHEPAASSFHAMASTRRTVAPLMALTASEATVLADVALPAPQPMTTEGWVW